MVHSMKSKDTIKKNLDMFWIKKTTVPNKISYR